MLFGAPPAPWLRENLKRLAAGPLRVMFKIRRCRPCWLDFRTVSWA